MTKSKKVCKQAVLCKQAVYKTGVWLAAEIWLNLIGLDNIADYSEYIFAYDLDLYLNFKHQRTVKIIDYPPQFCPQINDFCPLSITVTKITDLEGNDFVVQLQIFKSKCQKLAKPCLKLVCLTSIYYSVSIN